MKIIAILLFTLFGYTIALAQAEPSSQAKVEELYLARDDGSGKAGDQVSAFQTTDIPIYCVVLLDSAQKVTVKMNFVAVVVPGMKAETKVVTASYTTKEGQNRINFSGRPEGKWPPGRYRVDIFLDGKPAKALEFDINHAASGSGGDNTAGKYKLAEEPKKRTARKPPKQ